MFKKIYLAIALNLCAFNVYAEQNDLDKLMALLNTTEEAKKQYDATITQMQHGIMANLHHLLDSNFKNHLSKEDLQTLKETFNIYQEKLIKKLQQVNYKIFAEMEKNYRILLKESFTEAEIKELIAFLQSSVGKKFKNFGNEAGAKAIKKAMVESKKASDPIILAWQKETEAAMIDLLRKHAKSTQ